MIILVFGIQGSGKSTHAHYIAKKLNLPYISTGDILREMEKEPNEKGREIKTLMEKGQIIPDSFTIPALEDYMQEKKIKESFVMEGFPRTMEQAEYFKFKPDKIFQFVLPEEEAIKRLNSRGRYDDKDSSIKTRMELFKEKTLPVIDYFKKTGTKVFEVSNEKTIEEVQKEIDELLKN